MITEDLTVETTVVDDIGIARADGIIDLGTMRPLREAVRRLLSEGVKHVVLDLRQVGFLDSAGVSVLVTARRGVAERGGEVFVATEHNDVERALRMIQIDRVIHIIDDPDDAVRRIQRGDVPELNRTSVESPVDNEEDTRVVRSAADSEGSDDFDESGEPVPHLTLDG